MSGTISGELGRRSAALVPRRIDPPSSRLSTRLRDVRDALEDLFIQEGFAQFTIGDLAARLKCSRRTLYELAPSKEELVLIVLDRRLRRTGAMAATRAQILKDPLERLEAYMLAGASALKRTTIEFRRDVAEFPAAQRLIADHYRYATAVISELIDEGIASGRFRSVRSDVVAQVIDAALERLQDPEVLRTLTIDFEDGVTELTSLVQRGLIAHGVRATKT